ncbi:TSC complex subunit 1a isoform X1 [Gadus macrocephalus]|uniref:TSC complex subunit 1a isoform X1 n=1 Tax=Gadus macrocephalus TaxID=80720 RepID=UPI0028CB4019|nr:TSC complex subunit 1a isoform X1 [Gadus macrocephalus]XP_059909051.1 TSC complex subunit 1a isoform X1 [Gadus macrocephalus]XP_059909052.1 TSC complex subunit 1a isoform X1 [Gadus macrocephalus]
MSRDVGVSELLALLQSSDLKELEQVKSTISEQLNTDRGTVVLSSLLEFYLDSSSSEAALLLSSIREPLDKTLLEKLNDCLVKSVNRLASLTLLGHVVRRQPPWIHKISRSPLLPSLLRCLKGDSDVVVLVTGVLVLVALLPMIPQAGKRHIYDFFDVFGRLASWSHKNPSAVHEAYLVHLHASVYSLFHRLYGMFPCNFISYLRLHYCMKENLDVFHNIVKPMLEHVRVHPELVTGAQDSELDPSRWKCYEVHDIVIECAKVSLDPREEGCPQLADKWSCLRPDHLSLPPTPLTPLAQRLSGSSTSTPMSLSLMDGHSPIIQQWDSNDVIWSPSIECKLATPPASRGLSPATVSDTTLSPAQPLNRTTSISGLRYPASANVSPSPTMTLEHQQQKKQQPMGELESSASQQMKVKGKERRETNNNSGKSMSLNELSSFITETQGETGRHKERDDESITEELSTLSSPEPSLLQDSVSSRSLGSLGESSADLPQHSPPASSQQSFSLPSQFLFELAQQPTPAEEMKRSSGKEEASALGASVDEGSSLSPLELLDRLITQGYQAHQNLRMPNKALDWSYFGGKQQSMKTKGSAQGDELQMLRSQLLLVHGQLQYERYKRQQHAVRNRRLLREVIKSTTLEEHSTSMQAQLSLQEGEIQALRASLAEEQRRFYRLHDDSKTNTGKLQSQMEQQQQQLLDSNSTTQKLRIELQECRGRLGDLEAELQKANNEAYNAEHQLTQLSLKVSSSEELQQQMFLMNKHLVLLRETNRLLIEQRDNTSCQDTSRLRGRAEKELEEANKRLKELELANKKLSELETANQRLAEMEALLGRKEQMILDLKKLLEDTKIQARVELGACESRYVAVKRISQALNNELLELYSLLDPPAQTAARRNGGRGSIPISQDNRCLGAKPSSSLSILNGGVELLSTSPLSLSPIESPLDVGSFLGQRARMLFRPPGNSPEEGAELGEGAEPLESPDHDGECLEEEEQGEEARDLLHHQHSSSQLSPPPPPQQGSLLQDASSSILGIMDYDGMLLEY